MDFTTTIIFIYAFMARTIRRIGLELINSWKEGRGGGDLPEWSRVGRD